MFLEKLHQRGPGMPQSQKQVAAYFCSHLERASYQTIAQIAAATGVSETTVVRLAYALDFSSFSEMQRTIRQELLSGQAKPDMDCPQKDNDPYGYLLQHEMETLQEALRLLDREAMDRAVDLLCQADRVYTLGRRSSCAACRWFHSNAMQIRNNVFRVDDLTDFVDVTPDSVALVVCYHPYAKDTIALAKQIKELGARIILITDSHLSPATELADVVLLSGNAKHEYSFCNSITGPVAVMNVLMIGMTRKRPDYTERLRRAKRIRGNFNAATESKV